MRYRYSVWDPIFILILIAAVVLGIWALRVAPDTVPLHYNAAGEPDRWGEPSPFLLIGLPLILLLSMYPLLRGIDLFLLARKPEQYGLMTNIAGGTMALIGLVGFLPHLDILFGVRLGVAFILSLVGLLYVYMGFLFRLTPPENIPWNTHGLYADTPEGRAAMARGMGTGFIFSGFLTIPLAFLPGELSLISLAPLSFGPLVGVGLGLAKAPKAKRQ